MLIQACLPSLDMKLETIDLFTFIIKKKKSFSFLGYNYYWLTFGQSRHFINIDLAEICSDFQSDLPILGMIDHKSKVHK